jgi:hypothetical protein
VHRNGGNVKKNKEYQNYICYFHYKANVFVEPLKFQYHCCRLSKLEVINSRITSTKSPSFHATAFIASLTYLTALLPQSHDSGCYVSRWILATPPLWLQKHTDIRAHDFAHSLDLWRHHRLANVTCAWRCETSWNYYYFRVDEGYTYIISASECVVKEER